MGTFGLMPTSIGPSLSVTGLISQGIAALSPVLARLGTSTAVSKAGQVASTILKTAGGAAVGGAAIGASSGIAESVMNRLLGGQTLFTFGRKKRRRMNVCNAHALRRSIRRVQGFSKFARKSFILEKRVKMKKRRR